MSFDEKSNTLVIAQREGGGFRTALNRPEERNCLSPGLLGALPAAIDEAAGSEDTGFLLLEQRGDVPSSGVNYTALAGGGAGTGYPDSLDRLFRSRPEVRIPPVAAVRVGCTGAALGLLLKRQSVLAAQAARFALTGIHFAI